jgi:hypothetical protein
VSFHWEVAPFSLTSLFGQLPHLCFQSLNSLTCLSIGLLFAQ